MNNKMIGLAWFGIPLVLFSLSATGLLGFSPFGLTPKPETDLDYLNNCMLAGGWLIVGWTLPFLVGAILDKRGA